MTEHPLILVFGLPRSGTTWIGKIFDSHPDTLYRHEPDSGGVLNAIPLVAPVENVAAYRPVVERFLAELPFLNSVKVAASVPVFTKHYDSATSFVLRRFATVLGRAAAKVLGEVPVLSILPRSALPGLHVIWKSIESVGRLGVIVRSVPACRAILILRHPCGCIASVLRGEAERKFTDPEPSSDDYGIFEFLLCTPQARARGLSLELLKAMDPVERLAWRWVLFNEKALEDIGGIARCVSVRYEDVCADPMVKTRELFDFAGLAWHPQTESFVRESTSRNSDNYYSIFKDPISAATSWRAQLPAATVRRVRQVLRQSRLAEVYDE